MYKPWSSLVCTFPPSSITSSYNQKFFSELLNNCTLLVKSLRIKYYAQKCNFLCCFMWVWNLIPQPTGGTQNEAFENSVLMGMFWLKRQKVTGRRRMLHAEELHNAYCSSNIRVIKSKRMIWAGQVAPIGRQKMHIKF